MKIFVVFRPSSRGMQALDSLKVFEDEAEAHSYRNKISQKGHFKAWLVGREVEPRKEPK